MTDTQKYCGGRSAPVSGATFAKTSEGKAGAERLTDVATEQIICGASEALHGVRKQNSQNALYTYLMYITLDDTAHLKKQKNSHLPARARANVSGNKVAERHLKYSDERVARPAKRVMALTANPPLRSCHRAPFAGNRPQHHRNKKKSLKNLYVNKFNYL